MTSHATYFPGASYQSYMGGVITYHRRCHPWQIIKGGVTKICEEKDFTIPELNILAKGWTEFVHIDTSSGVCTRKFPDGSTKLAGLWHFNNGTLNDLLDQCEKYDMVFIYITGNTREMTNQWKVRYHKQAKFMHKLQNEYRGKVAFIAYGLFDYEIYYCMGLEGGARNAGWFYESGMVLPDGNRGRTGNGMDWGIWKRFVKERGFTSNIIASVYIYTQVSRLNAEYYAKPRYPVNRMAMAKKMDDADRTNFYFCLNFRNLSKKDATKSRHVKSGLNSLRPDQHRFIFGDGLSCNSCSLSYCCLLYKKNGVCVVEGTEGSELVEKFKSDNIEDIISGMQDIVADQVFILDQELTESKRRITEGKRPVSGIGKMINDVLRNSEKLIKLKDPSFGRPEVKVSIESGKKKQDFIEGEVVEQPQLEAMSDREKSQIIREMVTAGFRRETITGDDIIEFVEKKSGKDSVF